MKKINLDVVFGIFCGAVILISYPISLLLHPTPVQAATVINNGTISIPSVSTSAAVTAYMDIAPADSASWQMAFVCATGQAKLQQSNDNVTYTDLNVAGSSITVSGASITTTRGLYSITTPAYRYIQFSVANSSAPASGLTATPCSFTAIQLLKSDTVISN